MLSVSFLYVMCNVLFVYTIERLFTCRFKIDILNCGNFFFSFSTKVGSFARGLFLVHSECLETNYISSRPFRVNAVSSD